MRFGRSLAVAGLVGSAAIVAAPMIMSPAGATLTGIKCGKLVGTVTGTVTASKCTGNTGGASKPISSSALGSGSGTITWVNNTTTGIKFKTSTTESDTGETQGCPATLPSEIEIKGSVTSDTTGSTTVGAKFKAEVCTDGNNIALEPGTKAVIKPS
jgi:hypothetical protein